eukprot:g28293.t1
MSGNVVVDAAGKRLYGMDAEHYQKMQSKRDLAYEAELLHWIGEATATGVADVNDAWVSLKSGVVLCQLISTVSPHRAKYTVSNNGMVQRDNIDSFLLAAKAAGLPPDCLFETSDLSGGNMTRVINCVEEIGERAMKRWGWRGSHPPTRSGTRSRRIDLPSLTPPATTPSKTWKPVLTATRTIHVDDTLSGDARLVRELECDARLVRELQLELADLRQQLREGKANAFIPQAPPTRITRLTAHTTSWVGACKSPLRRVGQTALAMGLDFCCLLCLSYLLQCKHLPFFLRSSSTMHASSRVTLSDLLMSWLIGSALSGLYYAHIPEQPGTSGPIAVRAYDPYVALVAAAFSLPWAPCAQLFRSVSMRAEGTIPAGSAGLFSWLQTRAEETAAEIGITAGPALSLGQGNGLRAVLAGQVLVVVFKAFVLGGWRSVRIWHMRRSSAQTSSNH